MLLAVVLESAIGVQRFPTFSLAHTSGHDVEVAILREELIEDRGLFLDFKLGVFWRQGGLFEFFGVIGVIIVVGLLWVFLLIGHVRIDKK